MRGQMYFDISNCISWNEHEEQVHSISDTHDFILALLEKNPNVSYDIFSKRYSMHEDEIGWIENRLIERFATPQEKERYRREYEERCGDIFN